MAEYIDKQEAIETVAFYREDPDGIDHALNSIKSIPSADVVPVAHGRWSEELVCGGMNEMWDYTCSVCGGVVHNPYHYMSYCPNCGAKMDGDDNG